MVHTGGFSSAPHGRTYSVEPHSSGSGSSSGSSSDSSSGSDNSSQIPDGVQQALKEAADVLRED